MIGNIKIGDNHQKNNTSNALSFDVLIDGVDGCIALGTCYEGSMVYIDLKINKGGTRTVSLDFDINDFHQLMEIFGVCISDECKCQMMVDISHQPSLVKLRKRPSRGVFIVDESWVLSIDNVSLSIDETVLKKIIRIGRWL